MKFSFTRDLTTELFDLERHFKKSLLPWWDDIYIFLDRIDEDLTWNTMPALIMSLYKYLGLNKDISVHMTNIFKTIYFSNSIHAFVKDDDEGQKYNQELQFNILIGDYIFGRVLKLLLEAGAVQFLRLFSDMICQINEGMVMKYKLNASYEQVLRKTRAPLYETAFVTAAQLATADEEKCRLYRTMGSKLGMAIELLEHSTCRGEAMAYAHESQKIFWNLNQQKKLVNSSLEKAINELHFHICQMDKAAVV